MFKCFKIQTFKWCIFFLNVEPKLISTSSTASTPNDSCFLLLIIIKQFISYSCTFCGTLLSVTVGFSFSLNYQLMQCNFALKAWHSAWFLVVQNHDVLGYHHRYIRPLQRICVIIIINVSILSIRVKSWIVIHALILSVRICSNMTWSKSSFSNIFIFENHMRWVTSNIETAMLHKNLLTIYTNDFTMTSTSYCCFKKIASFYDLRLCLNARNVFSELSLLINASLLYAYFLSLMQQF